MKADWNTFLLGDLIHVKHGWAFKSKFFASEGEHIVLTPGNFYEKGGFKSREDKDRCYVGEYPEDYLLSKGDLIIAMTEQGAGLLGSSALIPSDDLYLHNQRLGLVTVKDEEEADLNFIYRLFNTEIVRMQISGSASGAKVRHTAPERVYRCKVKIPPLPTQQKIAHILSTYDDLIENNLQRIKLLEEMAQITYEQWFVRMKFPGHEATPIDADTGLPEGWSKKPLAEVTDYINRGVAPKYVETDGIPVINQKCIRDNYVNFSLSRLTCHSKKLANDKLLRKYDVLVNSTGTGTLGRTGQVFDIQEKATVDTHVTIVRGNHKVSPLYLGRALETLEPFIVSLGKGATNQQELGRVDLAQIIKLIIPPLNLQKEYENLVEKNYQASTIYREQNQLLKEARDILLPRLMTGLINVDDIDLPTCEPNKETT